MLIKIEVVQLCFFFGPENIGLLPKYSILLASSQLTMSIQ